MPNEFVVCSNQFWVHKNHRLLFKAISLLRQSGKNIHLVCTGLTNDFRCPDYLNQLNQSLQDMKITDLVHILGAMLNSSEKLANYLPPPFDLSIETLAKYQHIIAQIIRNHSLTIALHGLSIGKTQNDEG